MLFLGPGVSASLGLESVDRERWREKEREGGREREEGEIDKERGI